jgi:hypothetical protein
MAKSSFLKNMKFVSAESNKKSPTFVSEEN